MSIFWIGFSVGLVIGIVWTVFCLAILAGSRDGRKSEEDI